MRALWLIVPFLAIIVIAYRYYSAFIAARVLVLDDARVDAGAHEVRRPELLPDHPVGPLRPPLRGHHRRRAR